MFYKELPETTEKQQEIITLVYRFRFINRHQIQKILNHKDPKRINTWLKDLVEKGYLGRIYSKKLLENTKPAIYYLNNNGIIWSRFDMACRYRAEYEHLEFKYVKKFYQDKTASQTFINHCIILGELHVQLIEEARNSNGKISYYYQTKTESWLIEQIKRIKRKEDFNEFKNYIADVFIEKHIELEKDDVDYSTFFLELFDPHVPRYAIRYRINQYIKLHEEEDWERYAGFDNRFPTIMLIFADQRKVNSAARYIKEQLENNYVENMLFLLTTREKIISEGLQNHGIWKEIKTAIS